MDLNCKKTFNTIRKRFISGDYNIDTIECMVDEIGHMICSLSSEEFTQLIEIPRSVLVQDVDIKDYTSWQEKNVTYFHGNVKCFKEQYFVELSNKILNKEYYIEDMIETIDYIKSNFDIFIRNHGRSAEIPLRNVEVVFSDCIVINNENLMANGDLFAKVIEKVIKLD